MGNTICNHCDLSLENKKLKRMIAAIIPDPEMIRAMPGGRKSVITITCAEFMGWSTTFSAEVLYDANEILRRG